ncbi:type II secretion system protein GspG [Candidatus Sumerlaeota bacterium]|nr:type II secretion system protein GspG [Candidatus Sumerlaeota bacterium]
MMKKTLLISLMIIFLFACEKEEEEIIQKNDIPSLTKPAITKPGGAQSGWKGTGPNKRFYMVAEKLDRDGDFYLYMDIEGAFRELAVGFQQLAQTPQTPDEFKTILPTLLNRLETTGLFNMVDFGMSGIQKDDRYQYKTCIKANDTKTVLFQMLGSAPHDSSALKYAPGDTIIFHAMDLDLSVLLAFIKSLSQGDSPLITSTNYDNANQKFREEFGASIDELVSSLGTEFAFLARLDPEKTITIPDSDIIIPQPQFAFIIPTKQKILHDALAFSTKKDNIAINISQSDNIRRCQVSQPPDPDYPMNPEFMFDGEYEIVCSHVSLSDEIIKALKNGQGLSASPEFQDFTQNLPQQYNGLTFISEKLGLEIIHQISLALNAEEMKGKVNHQAFSDFLGIFLGGRMSVRINEPDGLWIVTQHKGKKDAMTFSGISNAVLMTLNSGGALSVVAILSAIAIPNFLEAQVRSKVAKTKADMRSLTTALESYCVDFGTYPSPGTGNLKETPHTLTTPVAYMTHIPEDTFSPEKGGKIRYYMKDNVYLLYAAGPDRVIDIDPETDFDPQNLEKLKEKAYDPTNGTVSSGDIIRTNRGI